MSDKQADPRNDEEERALEGRISMKDRCPYHEDDREPEDEGVVESPSEEENRTHKRRSQSQRANECRHPPWAEWKTHRFSYVADHDPEAAAARSCIPYGRLQVGEIAKRDFIEEGGAHAQQKERHNHYSAEIRPSSLSDEIRPVGDEDRWKEKECGVREPDRHRTYDRRGRITAPGGSTGSDRHCRDCKPRDHIAGVLLELRRVIDEAIGTREENEGDECAGLRGYFAGNDVHQRERSNPAQQGKQPEDVFRFPKCELENLDHDEEPER